jgi:hypothetical protein
VVKTRFHKVWVLKLNLCRYGAAGIINQLMGDAAPAVRAAAVEGICRILNTFWELVPAPTTAAFLAKLVDDLARWGCIKLLKSS